MIDIVSNELPRSPEKPNQKFKILVIEDDPRSLERINKLFANKSYLQMDVAGKGEEALVKLEQAKKDKERFNLVIADWRMGDELGGLKIAQRITDEGLAGNTFLLTVFDVQELNDYFFAPKREPDLPYGKYYNRPDQKGLYNAPDELKGDLAQYGVGKIISNNRIEDLYDLVHAELHNQGYLETPKDKASPKEQST